MRHARTASKFLRPTEVFNKRELQTESGVVTWITPIKPPHLDGSLGSFTMPATFTMPAGCLNASEKLTRWAAKYGTIADSMFSSKCSGWGLTFAPQWQSLLGNCRASHTLGNSHVGVGITSHHPFRSSAISFLVPKKTGSVSCHRSLPPEWPSCHSAIHDGNPVTQVVHQREQMDCVHWYIRRIYAHLHCKDCTEIPVVHVQWSNILVQLGHLLSGIYQGGQVASKGEAPCLPELLAYLHLIPRTGQNSCQFGPRSVAAPRLGDQFQQVWFITQPAVQFHWHAIQYVHLHCDTSAQNGVKSRTHWKSHLRVTARDLHKTLGILTFMSTLVPRGQLCLHTQSNDGHQRPGVRRQGPGQTGFQWPWPFSMRRLGGPPLQCCRGSQWVP